MGRLKTKLETLDLDEARRWVLEHGRDFLVEEHIPLETWNRYVTRNTLPHNLKLSQLVWSAETVWLVEFTVSPEHEAAGVFCNVVLAGQLGNLLARTGHMTLNTPNQPTFEADATFRPARGVQGIQVPPGVAHRDWVTVIVEILYSQSWSSAHDKVNVYRQRAGVEYIICVKMSPELSHWAHEVYDVRDEIPALGNMTVRHEFDIETVNAPHVVVLQTWRVLGLQQRVVLPPLPDGRVCPPTVQIDIVDMAQAAMKAW